MAAAPSGRVVQEKEKERKRGGGGKGLAMDLIVIMYQVYIRVSPPPHYTDAFIRYRHVGKMEERKTQEKKGT